MSVPYRIGFKWVGRYSSGERKLRVLRLLYAKPVNAPIWYSAALSVNIVAHAFGLEREWESIRVTFLGIQLHYQRSFGGWCV
jgi:hypothetical protein